MFLEIGAPSAESRVWCRLVHVCIVSALPIPAFHHCEPLCVACTQCTVECRNG